MGVPRLRKLTTGRNWSSNYGSPDNAAGFKSLRAYSHNR